MCIPELSNKNTTLPKYQLFSNRDSQLGEEDIKTLLKEARYELALFFMESEQYEEAIKYLSKVHSPEAAFEEGMVCNLIITKHSVVVAQKCWSFCSEISGMCHRIILDTTTLSSFAVLQTVGSNCGRQVL